MKTLYGIPLSFEFAISIQDRTPPNIIYGNLTEDRPVQGIFLPFVLSTLQRIDFVAVFQDVKPQHRAPWVDQHISQI